MDLKTALKDILPTLKLKAKPRAGDKWAIDRPIEFRECYTCGEMVDERIVDIACITAHDSFCLQLYKEHETWCQIHNSLSVKALLPKVQPCPRCFRWTVGHRMCSMCGHNLHTTMPPPMIAKRSWYVPPKETHASGL